VNAVSQSIPALEGKFPKAKCQIPKIPNSEWLVLILGLHLKFGIWHLALEGLTRSQY
jgi:hypothetical protein